MEIAEILIRAGANANAVNDYDITPLMLASASITAGASGGCRSQHRTASENRSGTAIGGMMDKPAGMPAPAWLFYFNVPSIRAAAALLGELTWGRNADKVARRVCPDQSGGNNYWPSAYSPRTKLMYIPALSNCVTITIDRAKHNKELGWNGFECGCGLGFALGGAMFGAITFLPLYLQIAKGASPTMSGLEMIPLTAGILSATTITGRYMTNTGRYRIMPIIGQVLKQSLKETMHLDYVTLSRTKGYGEAAVIRREALPNAILPTLTLVGVQFTFLIGGLVVKLGSRMVDSSLRTKLNAIKHAMKEVS